MYQPYGLKIEQRRLAREKAAAIEIIKGTIKAAFMGGLGLAIALVGTYWIFIIAIDNQIDQNNITDCESVKVLSSPGKWQKLVDKCDQYYQTGEIDYMRQYHADLDK